MQSTLEVQLDFMSEVFHLLHDLHRRQAERVVPVSMYPHKESGGTAVFSVDPGDPDGLLDTVVDVVTKDQVTLFRESKILFETRDRVAILQVGVQGVCIGAQGIVMGSFARRTHRFFPETSVRILSTR